MKEKQPSKKDLDARKETWKKLHLFLVGYDKSRFFVLNKKQMRKFLGVEE